MDEGYVENHDAVSGETECTNCGALLKFKPGTTALACEYCGAQNEIVDQKDEKIEVVENDLTEEALQEKEASGDTITAYVVKCDSCGAETTFDPNVSSGSCPYCDPPLVVKGGGDKKPPRPAYLLPFKLDVKEATKRFKEWVSGLWFAPSKLKQYAANFEKLVGMYVPHWTFDAETSTDYTGMRGDNYTTTETYTTVEDGKTVTKTRTVTKIRWTPASGRVRDSFDDILVVASNSLPRAKADALEPWDLENLVGYDDKFLAGFRTENYQVSLKEGYAEAKDKMKVVIKRTIKRDIGGDHQQITTMNTTYSDQKFKHILLPIYISAYRFKEKVYRFLVNARTGEVQGERPWSWVKIAFAILGALAVIGGGYYVYVNYLA